jgi:hypothetical protein
VSQLVVHPHNAASAVHERVDDPTDFDSSQWPNALLGDSGDIEYPDNLPPELRPQLNPWTDRVLSTRMQTFGSQAFTLHCSSLFGTATLDISGSPLTLASTSNWRPLERRRTLMLAIAGGGALVSLATPIFYGSRHAFYSLYGHPCLAILPGIAVALSIAVLVGLLALRREARPVPHVAGSGAALLAACVLTISACSSGGPTASGAREALARHDFDRAALEARALIDLGLDPDAGRAVADDMHLARLRDATTSSAARVVFAEPWERPRGKETARLALVDLVDREASLAYENARDAELLVLASTLDVVDAPAAAKLRGRATLVRARQCIAADGSDCAVTYLDEAKSILGDIPEVADTEQRLIERARKRKAAAVATSTEAKTARQRYVAILEAIAASTLIAARTSTPDPEAATLSARLPSMKSAADAEDARDRAAQAQVEARLARERAQEQAAQRAAEQREAAHQASRRLLCADGTPSPTCMCQGSHRGCCSWHGGVAGCTD